MTDSTKTDFESPLWDEQIWQKLDAEGSLKVSKIDDSATTREIPKHEIQSESRQNDGTENNSDLKKNAMPTSGIFLGKQQTTVLPRVLGTLGRLFRHQCFR